MSLEADVFEMIRMITAKNATGACKKLQTLLRLQQEPIAITGAMIGSYVDLYRVKLGASKRKSYAAVFKDFGYKGSDYRLKRSAETASHYTLGQLETCLQVLLDLDKSLKRPARGCADPAGSSALPPCAGRERTMSERELLHTDRVLVVEGKYDAARLSHLTDAMILLTDGFGIYSDKKRQQLFKALAQKNGLILLTDRTQQASASAPTSPIWWEKRMWCRLTCPRSTARKSARSSPARRACWGSRAWTMPIVRTGAAGCPWR